MLNPSKYRVPTDGSFQLADYTTDDTQGLSDKDAAKTRFKDNRDQLIEWQERLYAEGKQSLLIVLQAMDTAGKDSTIEKMTRGINPQGCRVTSFKAPSKEELAHDFLWRIHDHAPQKGTIAIFNRSHYEDVLIVKVHGWADAETIEQRYEHINNFEKMLADSGTRIIKFMLNISKDYQLERLRRRLKRPDKYWKFNPDDLEEREKWDQYMAAYEVALQRTSTPWAPWYVIPAEHRWFRDLLINRILLDAADEMDPQYPEPTFKIEDYPPESLT